MFFERGAIRRKVYLSKVIRKCMSPLPFSTVCLLKVKISVTASRYGSGNDQMMWLRLRLRKTVFFSHDKIFHNDEIPISLPYQTQQLGKCFRNITKWLNSTRNLAVPDSSFFCADTRFCVTFHERKFFFII
jgi:hypothetical protein